MKVLNGTGLSLVASKIKNKISNLMYPETNPSYFTFSGNTLTGYIGTLPSNIVVPSSYSLGPVVNGVQTYTKGTDYEVKIIGANAFDGNNTLTSVRIKDNITTIGNQAFRDCTAFKTIYIGTNVNSIGSGAFLGCSFDKVVFDAKYYKNTNNFGGHFIIKRDGTLRILNYFSNCPDSYTWGYANLNQLITNVDFSFATNRTPVLSSSEHLQNTTSLKSINLPDGLEIIPSSFLANSAIESINIPSSVTTINYGAFSDCANLDNVILPQLVETISESSGSGAQFKNCTSLKQIILSESMTSISSAMFSGCSALKNIIIPRNVTEIHGTAFYNCSSLEAIYVIPNSVPTLSSYNAFYGTNDCPIYVKGPYVSSYQTANEWSTYSSRISAVNAIIFKSISQFTLSYNYSSLTGTLDYSLDNVNWTQYTIGDTLTSTNTGILLLRGSNNGQMSLDSSPITYTNSNGDLYCVYSNIENLIDYSTTAMGLHPSTVANQFDNLFYNTKLKVAPELDCPILKSAIYQKMFGSTKLEVTPELPALEVYSESYKYMFTDCSELIKACELPATIIADSCYYNMFLNCKKLKQITTNLPATTLATKCYYAMFYNCESITAVPIISATTLATYCYHTMFYNCKSIATVPSNYLPVTTLASYCYESMFEGCSSLTNLPNLPATTLSSYCYSNMFKGCSALTIIPNNYLPATIIGDSCYQYMFSGCSALTSVPTNLLPATILTSNCYRYMFKGCSSLTSVPNLPATTLSGDCYSSMFQGCSALTSVPTNLLPATNLYLHCYSYMFQDCVSLLTAPNLPATTIGDSCYYHMFDGCTSLKYAPRIDATTYTGSGVYTIGYMFAGCISLETIPAIKLKKYEIYVGYNLFAGCTKIKISTTQSAEYPYEYRFPPTGTATSSSSTPGYELYGAFNNTGGTFTDTPNINTTYYTANQIVS